ncbi:carbon-nitrogen hydrolase family protein [Kribbella ginsengisoli]|uniref:CN hydrolase domain-containing protein n=1 Tax=Kribbella ginsengisoli TaxID=363865 RepID=A0ABP6X716_9ACTN
MRIAAHQSAEHRLDLEAALQHLESATPDVDLALFPECYLQGYLTDCELAAQHAIDLRSDSFSRVLDRLAPVRPALVFGLIEREDHRIYNTAVLVRGGRLIGSYRKRHLLAGEQCFTPGDGTPVFELDGTLLGVNICYDLQFADGVAALSEQGASVVLAPCSNMMRPAAAAKYKQLHHPVRQQRAREGVVWIISADVTGPLDAERVSYGPTSAIDPNGAVVAQVPLLAEGRIVVEV